MFRVISPELFTPNCSSIIDPYVFQGRKLASAYQNSYSNDPLNQKCMVKLTIVNRLIEGGREIELKVELSLPKLLFGNSFDEIKEQDFVGIVKALDARLKGMGIVVVNIEDIARAPVSAIHYGKNVALTDYTTSSMIISELAKVDVDQRMDISESKFRNAGYCLHYHADSFEVIFYDKLRELKQAMKSKKRTIEKDSLLQMNIFEAMSKVKPFEVLRMEVRLGKRQKIKSLFKILGVTANLNLNELFKQEIAQKVLLYFWDKIDTGLSVFQMDASSPIDLLRGIKKNHPNMQPSKLLKLVGAIILIQDVGMRPLREALDIKSENAKVWYSLKRDLKNIDQLKVGDKYRSILKVKDALNVFTPLKLADYDIQF